jgi:hypothetical protein
MENTNNVNINANTPLLLTTNLSNLTNILNSKNDSTNQQKLHIIIEMPEIKESNCIRCWYLLIFVVICIIFISVFFVKYNN